MSGRVFVDASGYYTFIDRDEADHAQALRTFQRLTSDQAERVLEGLYASSIRIIRPTERDETRAREIIRQQSDKEYSFADAISFAVMERLHIRHAWTYDHHFSQYGWQLEP